MMTKKQFEEWKSAKAFHPDDGIVGMIDENDTADSILNYEITTCCGLYELALLGDSFESWPVKWLYFMAGLQTLSQKAAGVMATTINSQKDVIQLLKEFRFQRIRLGRNPNSGNQISVWFKSLDELNALFKKERKHAKRPRVMPMSRPRAREGKKAATGQGHRAGQVCQVPEVSPISPPVFVSEI